MQIRAETTAQRLKTRDLRQNFQIFKSILNSGALFFSLDKDKKVIRISQVSDHDRSGVAHVVEKYAQRRHHFARRRSKTRDMRQKFQTFKNEQNSQCFEVKLGTHNFLHNIRQSLVHFCYIPAKSSSRLGVY